MISPMTWLWNFKHRKLLEETRRLIRIQMFLMDDIGLREDIPVSSLRMISDTLRKSLRNRQTVL